MNDDRRILPALPVFLFLAFALSWAMWWPGSILAAGLDPTLAGLVGAFGPSTAGVITLICFHGRHALKQTLAKLFAFRVGLRWYLIVLLYPAALSLVITLVVRALGGDWPDFSRPLFVDHYPLPPEARQLPFLFFLPLVFLQQTLIGSSMGEEIGWRGYLLPRLQSRLGAVRASILLGIIWGLWHLPLAFTPGDLRSEIPFAWTILGTIATAVMFTWVYNNTRGSLLVALLFHTSITITGLFLAAPAIHPGLSFLAGLAAPAAIVIATRGDLGCRNLNCGP